MTCPVCKLDREKAAVGDICLFCKRCRKCPMQGEPTPPFGVDHGHKTGAHDSNGRHVAPGTLPPCKCHDRPGIEADAPEGMERL